MPTTRNSASLVEASKEEGSPNKRDNLSLQPKSVSPSSLRKKKKQDPVVVAARKSVSIIMVNPSHTTGTPCYGFIIVCKGFMMDKWLTDVMHRGRDDIQKKEYVDLIGCAPRVLYCKDINNNNLKKVVGSKVYDIKCLAFLSDEPPEIKSIMQHVNNTVSPAIWNQYLQDEHAVSKGFGSIENLPKLIGDDHDDVWEVDTWDKALQRPEDAYEIADDMDGECFGWLREDTSHLYGLFQEGNVPIKEFKRRRLPPNLLRGPDKIAYEECNN